MLLFFSSCTWEPDDTPPAAPTGVGTRNGYNYIEIYWDENTESDLDGYNVYWSPTEFGEYQPVAEHLGKNQTYFQDNRIALNQSYYYKVTAFDDSDNESGFSNPALGYVVGGVTSITGDGEVSLEWDECQIETIERFRIYRGDSATQIDSIIGEVLVSDSSYLDQNLQNGATYFYAVSAYDDQGNEGGKSVAVDDTPRPEGHGLILKNRSFYSENGIDFSDYLDNLIINYNIDSLNTDVYLEDNHLIVPGFSSFNRILEYGLTNNLNEVNEVPINAQWNSEGKAEVNVNQSYIVSTELFGYINYAHIRITDVYGDSIKLDWAYQIQAGNPELKSIPPGGTNP